MWLRIQQDLLQQTCPLKSLRGAPTQGPLWVKKTMKGTEDPLPTTYQEAACLLF